MTFSNQPVDAGNIPTSSVYNQYNQFETLMGEPGAFQDTNSNPSTPAVMSFLRPQIVQSNHAITGSGGKTLTCAFPNNNIAGNSIVVCVGLGEVENGSTITLALTDTNSNTYSEAVKASQSTTLEAAIFLATRIGSGANTITVTIAGGSSSNTAIAVEIYEVHGLIAVAGSGALDQTSTGSAASGTAVTTSTVTPIVPNELAFSAIAAAGGTVTAGTGFTLDSGSLAPTGGNLVSFGSESQVLTTLSSVTGTATLSGSNAWAIALATFKSVIVPIAGSVVVLSLPALPTGANTVGAVTQSGTWTQVPNTATTGGSTPFHALSAASNNATNVKNSAGQVYGFSISNTNAAARFFKLYDKATAPAPATDNALIKQTIQIPANTTVIRVFPLGMVFSNGIGFAAVANISDTDNTSIGASDLSIDLDYK